MFFLQAAVTNLNKAVFASLLVTLKFILLLPKLTALSLPAHRQASDRAPRSEI